MATPLVPAQRVLSLFDPIPHVAASVIYLDHLPGRELRIGYNEPDPREEFPIVPFDLRYNSAISVPRLCLIPEINQFNPNPTLGSPPHGTGQIGSMRRFKTAFAGSLIKYVTSLILRNTRTARA